MSGSPIRRAAGPAIVLAGDDMDTDRVMPARFLKAITFEGLEAHLFADDRREASDRGLVHPFDEPTRRGARVLVVGRNFGCGSSREHAPQGLFRWGIRAVVGASFAEIFAGNALMIGLPCVTVRESDLAVLRDAVAADPAMVVTVDLDVQTVSAGERSMAASMPEAARQALISGAWDGTGLLLEDYDQVQRVAAALPYIAGY